MCNHTIRTFTSDCLDCLDSLYAAPTHATLASSYANGDYIHTNIHGATNEFTVISGNVFYTSLMSRPMNCTLEDILARGGSVIRIEPSFDCLSCDETVFTDNEDDCVIGLCDCCLDGDYPSPYDPPAQSDCRDYSCHCEDAPCCGCNSERGQVAVLFIAIVAILTYVLATYLMPFVSPVLAALDGLQ